MNNNHINTSCWLLSTDYKILWCVYSLVTFCSPSFPVSYFLVFFFYLLSFLYCYCILYFNSNLSLKSFFFLFSYSNMIFSTVNLSSFSLHSVFTYLSYSTSLYSVFHFLYSLHLLCFNSLPNYHIFNLIKSMFTTRLTHPFSPTVYIFELRVESRMSLDYQV